MKNNIYQFPQAEELKLVKKSIKTGQRKKILVKLGRIIMTGIRKLGKTIMTTISWLWFALRITIANMLHIATVTLFTFLHAFQGFIFVIGGLCCIFMYYHLDKHFTTPDNYTIPFFVGIWVISCASEAITSMLHYEKPFHRIFAVFEVKSKDSF